MDVRRTTGFTGRYAATAKFAIEHRGKFLAGSLLVLVLGGVFFSRLKTSFFPEDVQYWSFIDVWLPNDSNLETTNRTAQQVERIVREQAETFGRNHPGKHQQPVLKYVSTFVGGGGPRFWFSFSPQQQQLNYAQVLIEVTDKDITPQFVQQLQPVLTAGVAGARLDVRQLQTNPVDFPVQVRIASEADVNAEQSAENIATLRQLTGQVEDIFRGIPSATRVRNDWEAESSTVSLKVDPDRANLAGITNLDVAQSSTTAISGAQVTTLREGDKQIPVVARLRADERGQLSDIQNLYVYSSENNNKIPLLQISKVVNRLQTQRIVRLEHFRTISVSCFPVAGVLPSEILNVAKPKLVALQKSLPPGFSLQIGGEYDKQKSGFLNLAVVMAISIAMIFLALLFQFNSAVKPILVFAAAPFGIAGAVAALWIMGAPFGFMAFLGIASLVGVIVSHVIVLFDFIEERREEGEPFEEAVIDAGIIRLRPVMITVGATVLALFPLALHGGPLWQPLCYAQIGGLCVATFVTLLLVPVLYSIFVLDLKILKWETQVPATANPETPSKA
jgi:multidrug efflux pump subunit AcrB